MTGILHLVEVPKIAKNADGVPRLLINAVRNFCDTDHGRMIPIEDECFKLLSWFPVSEAHVAFVRVANVDATGKPFAQIAFADGLYRKVIERLTKGGWRALNPVDHPQQYEYHYTPTVFNNTDYLYVPDSIYCKTLVLVQSKTPATIDCN